MTVEEVEAGKELVSQLEICNAVSFVVLDSQLPKLCSARSIAHQRTWSTAS